MILRYVLQIDLGALIICRIIHKSITTQIWMFDLTNKQSEELTK